MALASRKDLMRILTQPAQRKGLHHNLIDSLSSMHLSNEKMHEKVITNTKSCNEQANRM
jgi:hypothetical protein